MGEGAIAPIVMIRRGDLKYVHSPADPDQLYDLRADPDERVNLAADSDWDLRVKELRGEVERGWDLDRLYLDVVDDQARRRLIDGALRTGVVTPWEYTPPRDGSQQYMRNHLDLNDDARAWERGVDEYAEGDEEVAEYVEALEEAQDTADLPEATGEAIAREFERFLRRRSDGEKETGEAFGEG